MINYSLEQVPKLFANCIIVKGYKSGVICDLQREIYYPVPNDLCDLFTDIKDTSVKEILDNYGTKNESIIKEYLDGLLEMDLIHFVNKYEVDLFPALSLVWESPTKLTNAVIDMCAPNQFLIENLFLELESMNCQNIEVRLFPTDDNGFCSIIYMLNSLLLNSKFKCINIYTEYCDLNYIQVIKSVDYLQNRLGFLLVYNAPFNEIVERYKMGSIFITEQKLDYNNSCGIINPDYLNVNVPLFTEAQQHNTCLNRKISIDVNGEIKNCPSMAKSYGNIKDTTLAEAIEKPGFKDMWFINKDKIHVCKDCEFRYICTDCRAYIENPEDIYSKPLKCGYNPYTAEWEEWSTNPLKQKAIEYYGMQELVKKEK